MDSLNTKHSFAFICHKPIASFHNKPIASVHNTINWNIFPSQDDNIPFQRSDSYQIPSGCLLSAVFILNRRKENIFLKYMLPPSPSYPH